MFFALFNSIFSNDVSTVYYIFGFIVLVGSIVLVGRAKTIKSNQDLSDSTVHILQENNSALADKINILNSQMKISNEAHARNEKKITALQTEVENLKTIPLEKIAKHMESTNEALVNLTNVISTLAPITATQTTTQNKLYLESTKIGKTL